MRAKSALWSPSSSSPFLLSSLLLRGMVVLVLVDLGVCVKEMQTSPGASWLQVRLYLAMESVGEGEAHPRPNTKKGCSRPADTDTWRFLLPTLKLSTQSPVAWVGSSRTKVLWSIDTSGL